MKALADGGFAQNSNLVMAKSISDFFFIIYFCAAFSNINFKICKLICSQDFDKPHGEMGLSIYKIYQG